jgi:hypothetical protein
MIEALWSMELLADPTLHRRERHSLIYDFPHGYLSLIPDFTRTIGSQETGAAMMLSLPSYTHRLTHGTMVAGMGKAPYPCLGCYVNAEPHCSRWACSPTRSALRGRTLGLFVGRLGALVVSINLDNAYAKTARWQRRWRMQRGSFRDLAPALAKNAEGHMY